MVYECTEGNVEYLEIAGQGSRGLVANKVREEESFAFQEMAKG